MSSRFKKSWVLVLLDGPTRTVKAWRDYGDTAWGSPAYTVLGYCDGTYRDALRAAHSLADSVA